MGLPGQGVFDITRGLDGSHWFATPGGVAHYDGANWTVYDPSNSGVPHYEVYEAATDHQGSLRLGFSNWNGIAVRWYRPGHPIGDSAQWLDDHTYQGTYDITSLIPRGDYLVNVTGAAGTDGIEIAPVVGYTFTVDYAGAIGDTTPPRVPAVTACAGETMGALSGRWSASDADSEITLYSYAIGTSPGGGEVVNWTQTTAKSFDRTDLSLTTGQPYYVAVKARNEGGLWSGAGIPDAVYAGTGECTTNVLLMYIPVIMR